MASDSTEPAQTRTSAILLAAGRSERMGAFKPLMPFGHSTVIKSCIDSLSNGGVDDIVVVLGHRADEVRVELANIPVHIAINPEEHCEMNASIAYGVHSITATTGCLLLALVDQPAVPATVVQNLIRRWRNGAKLIVPTWLGRGGHPVLIDLSFRAELLTLSPVRGLKGLFEKHREKVVRLPVVSPYIARDMDTWDDYVELHKDVFGKHPSRKG